MVLYSKKNPKKQNNNTVPVLIVSYWVSVWRLGAAGPLGFLCQWRSKPQGLIHGVYLITAGFREERRHDYSWRRTNAESLRSKACWLNWNGYDYRWAWLLWCSRIVPGSIMESCSTAESLLAEERHRRQKQSEAIVTGELSTSFKTTVWNGTAWILGRVDPQSKEC